MATDTATMVGGGDRLPCSIAPAPVGRVDVALARLLFRIRLRSRTQPELSMRRREAHTIDSREECQVPIASTAPARLSRRLRPVAR